MDKFEINSRIKEVRKHLGLTQDEFGERIGVSRNVIVNVELNRVEAKPLLVNQVCSEYGINKRWLRDGVGEMLSNSSDEADNTINDRIFSLRKEFGLSREGVRQETTYVTIRNTEHRVWTDRSQAYVVGTDMRRFWCEQRLDC